jgi:hypothetical protein
MFAHRASPQTHKPLVYTHMGEETPLCCVVGRWPCAQQCMRRTVEKKHPSLAGGTDALGQPKKGLSPRDERRRSQAMTPGPSHRSVYFLSLLNNYAAQRKCRPPKTWAHYYHFVLSLFFVIRMPLCRMLVYATVSTARPITTFKSHRLNRDGKNSQILWIWVLKIKTL